MSRGSWLGADFAAKGPLAMPADISGYHSWGGGGGSAH